MLSHPSEYSVDGLNKEKPGGEECWDVRCDPADETEATFTQSDSRTILGNITDKITIIGRGGETRRQTHTCFTVFIVRALVHEMCFTVDATSSLRFHPSTPSCMNPFIPNANTSDCDGALLHPHTHSHTHNPYTGGLMSHLAPGPAGRTTAPLPPSQTPPSFLHGASMLMNFSSSSLPVM